MNTEITHVSTLILDEEFRDWAAKGIASKRVGKSHRIESKFDGESENGEVVHCEFSGLPKLENLQSLGSEGARFHYSCNYSGHLDYEIHYLNSNGQSESLEDDSKANGTLWFDLFGKITGKGEIIELTDREISQVQ